MVWGLEKLWSDVIGIMALTIGGMMLSTVVTCMVKISRNKY